MLVKIHDKLTKSMFLPAEGNVMHGSRNELGTKHFVNKNKIKMPMYAPRLIKNNNIEHS